MKFLNRTFSNYLPAAAAVAALMLAGLACNNKSDAEWQQELGGKKLSRAKTSGSLSDKVNIWFCPTGEYVKQTQFSGFSTGGAGTLSMADDDMEYGRWRVTSGTLILQPENGSPQQYDLSQGMDQNVISLDGNGHLVEPHNECR